MASNWTKTPHLMGEDGEPVFLPFNYEICPCCNGHGKSSAYLGAYTRSEMDEQGSDFLEAYMAGEYDRRCNECDGDGKVKVADTSRMTPEQVKQLEEDDRFEAEYQAECEAERRMGC